MPKTTLHQVWLWKRWLNPFIYYCLCLSLFILRIADGDTFGCLGGKLTEERKFGLISTNKTTGSVRIDGDFQLRNDLVKLITAIARFMLLSEPSFVGWACLHWCLSGFNAYYSCKPSAWVVQPLFKFAEILWSITGHCVGFFSIVQSPIGWKKVFESGYLNTLRLDGTMNAKLYHRTIRA